MNCAECGQPTKGQARIWKGLCRSCSRLAHSARPDVMAVKRDKRAADQVAEKPSLPRLKFLEGK